MCDAQEDFDDDLDCFLGGEEEELEELEEQEEQEDQDAAA